MDKPRIDTTTVYSTAADLLPLEGRDYTIDAEFTPDGKPRLLITPKTPIGRAWVPFLKERLEKPMEANGVSVGEAASAVTSETVTIKSLRAKIEAEAKAALTKRIADANARQQAKMKEAAAAREAAVKAGRDARSDAAVRKANQEANEAAVAAHRLQRIASRIERIRSDVDAAATKAATDDEKDGKNWAVDMEAPLATLFERQDANDRFRQKEDLIFRIAEHAVTIDELRENAIRSAKQYIIPKPKGK